MGPDTPISVRTAILLRRLAGPSCWTVVLGRRAPAGRSPTAEPIEAQRKLDLQGLLRALPVLAKQAADSIQPLGHRVDVNVKLLGGAGKACPAGEIDFHRLNERGSPAS